MKEMKMHSYVVKALSFVFAALVLGTLALVATAPRAEARVDAVYTVPTEDPNLADAAEYATRSDQNAYGSPQATGVMYFELPSELTGVEAKFEISLTANGTWKGTGTDGSAVSGNCGRESRKWFACEVNFIDLKFDAIARDAILATQFGRGTDFDLRLAVARQFEGQPIGVIKVRIK